MTVQPIDSKFLLCSETLELYTDILKSVRTYPSNVVFFSESNTVNCIEGLGSFLDIVSSERRDCLKQCAHGRITLRSIFKSH